MSILRNKLTVYESRNQLLEQEKSDLTETVNMLSAEVKSEPDMKIHTTLYFIINSFGNVF